MDLSIASSIAVDSGSTTVIDPHSQQSLDSRYWTYDLPYELPPLTRMLAYTRLEVEIPASKRRSQRIAGLICLRSTWARAGLVAPPTIADPGFRGQLTMEIFNANRHAPVLIRLGDLIWHMLMVPAPLAYIYDGRYQGQMGLSFPKALPEIEDDPLYHPDYGVRR